MDEWSRLLIDSAMVYFDSLQFLMQYREEHDSSDNARTFTPMQRLVYDYSHMDDDIWVFIYA